MGPKDGQVWPKLVARKNFDYLYINIVNTYTTGYPLSKKKIKE